jgi:hypothetical protein
MSYLPKWSLIMLFGITKLIISSWNFKVIMIAHSMFQLNTNVYRIDEHYKKNGQFRIGVSIGFLVATNIYN